MVFKGTERELPLLQPVKTSRRTGLQPGLVLLQVRLRTGCGDPNQTSGGWFSPVFFAGPPKAFLVFGRVARRQTAGHRVKTSESQSQIFIHPLEPQSQPERSLVVPIWRLLEILYKWLGLGKHPFLSGWDWGSRPFHFVIRKLQGYGSVRDGTLECCQMDSEIMALDDDIHKERHGRPFVVPCS